jgi:Lar family restriction alleviation protein
MESKPCPFCGWENLETVLNRADDWYRVVCLDCGATGPGDGQITTAISLWNDRAEPIKEED